MPIEPSTLFLTMQTALMGNIPAELRAVGIRSVGGHDLNVRWFFDAEMNETTEDILRIVMTDTENYLPSSADILEGAIDQSVAIVSSEEELQLLPSEEWVFYRYAGNTIVLPADVPNLPLESLRPYIAGKALLGCITSNVRRVSLAIGKQQALLRYYVDGPAGGVEQELAELASQRLSQLLRLSFQGMQAEVTSEVVRLDVPHLMTHKSSNYSVYDRYEEELIDWAHITPEQDQEFNRPESFLP